MSACWLSNHIQMYDQLQLILIIESARVIGTCLKKLYEGSTIQKWGNYDRRFISSKRLNQSIAFQIFTKPKTPHMHERDKNMSNFQWASQTSHCIKLIKELGEEYFETNQPPHHSLNAQIKAQIIFVDSNGKFESMQAHLQHHTCISVDCEQVVFLEQSLAPIQIAIYLVDALSLNISPENWTNLGEKIFNSPEKITIGKMQFLKSVESLYTNHNDAKRSNVSMESWNVYQHIIKVFSDQHLQWRLVHIA